MPETGKVEYVVDPQVKTLRGHVTAFDDESLIAANRVAKRAALERAVIEACKAEHRATAAYEGNSTMENWNAIYPATSKRRESVAALIDFESQQEK